MFVEILSLQSTIFKQEVKSITIPSPNGLFEILDGHAPIISSLSKGKITLFLLDNERKKISVQSGVVKVENNRAIVLLS